MTEDQNAKLDKINLNGRKLDAWERTFIANLSKNRGWTLSDSRASKLNEIYRKVIGGGTQ